MLLKDYYNKDDEIDKTETDENNVLKSIKIGSQFQIMFYNNGYTTPLYVINAVEVYDPCKSRKTYQDQYLCII